MVGEKSWNRSAADWIGTVGVAPLQRQERMLAGKSTVKTINITMVLYCNTYSNVASQILLLRPIMCLKLF